MRRPTAEEDDDRRSRPIRTSRDDDDRPERSSRPHRDDDEDDRPRKKPRKKASGGVPAIVWILLVLLLLGGAGVGVYFAFFNKDKEKDGDSKDQAGTGDTGREGRLTNENFKRVKNGMTEQEVTRLLGPASLSQGQNLQGRQIRVLIWNARASQVIAQFVDGTLVRTDGSIWDDPDAGGGNPGGNDPIEPPGRLTVGNFKKVRLNMSEAETLQLLGNPSKVALDRMQGRNRTRLLEWEDKGAAKPTKVAVGFLDDFLIEASGTIDGQRVNARANTPGGGANNRVTQGNFQRISESTRNGQGLNRAQIIEILGPPTRNLGVQQSINGQQADETLIWRNGGTQITIWFLGGQNIGMHFNEKS